MWIGNIDRLPKTKYVKIFNKNVNQGLVIEQLQTPVLFFEIWSSALELVK